MGLKILWIGLNLGTRIYISGSSRELGGIWEKASKLIKEGSKVSPGIMVSLRFEFSTSRIGGTEKALISPKFWGIWQVITLPKKVPLKLELFTLGKKGFGRRIKSLKITFPSKKGFHSGRKVKKSPHWFLEEIGFLKGAFIGQKTFG